MYEVERRRQASSSSKRSVIAVAFIQSLALPYLASYIALKSFGRNIHMMHAEY
ncbi:MAG: hypothetical protein QXE12_02055 [Conexivisphaerales archaeon]